MGIAANARIKVGSRMKRLRAARIFAESSSVISVSYFAGFARGISCEALEEKVRKRLLRIFYASSAGEKENETRIKRMQAAQMITDFSETS